MQLHSAQAATDRALQAVGLHAGGGSGRAFAHAVAEQMTTAWSDLAARLHLSSSPHHYPSFSSAAAAASSSATDTLHHAAARAGAAADQLLKQLGLRDRSTLEAAADGVHRALHSLWVVVGVEDPTTAEVLAGAYAAPQHALRRALASLTSPLHQLTHHASSSSSAFSRLPGSLTYLPRHGAAAAHHAYASVTGAAEQLGASLKSRVGDPAYALFTADGLTETVRACVRACVRVFVCVCARTCVRVCASAVSEGPALVEITLSPGCLH